MHLMIPVFLMGTANFALHAAVLACRHPVFEVARSSRRRIRGVTLAVEFLALTAALSFAARDAWEVLWVYGIYTAINAVAAWLILTRRL